MVVESAVVDAVGVIDSVMLVPAVVLDSVVASCMVAVDVAALESPMDGAGRPC